MQKFSWKLLSLWIQAIFGIFKAISYIPSSITRTLNKGCISYVVKTWYLLLHKAAFKCQTGVVEQRKAKDNGWKRKEKTERKWFRRFLRPFFIQTPSFFFEPPFPKILFLPSRNEFKSFSRKYLSGSFSVGWAKAGIAIVRDPDEWGMAHWSRIKPSCSESPKIKIVMS